MSISLPPDRLQPARLLCLWDSQARGTGVGFHFLLQDLPDPRYWTMSPGRWILHTTKLPRRAADLFGPSIYSNPSPSHWTLNRNLQRVVDACGWYWLLQLVLKQGLIFSCYPLPPPILGFPYAGQQFSCYRWLVISSPFPSKPEGLEPLVVLLFLGRGCFDFLFPLLVSSMEKGFRQTASSSIVCNS